MLGSKRIQAIIRFAVIGLCFTAPVAALAQLAADKVKVEWLGHEFYRFTSPKGVVVVTSPWLGNPDGPVALADLPKVDFIVVPNAHNDDMGNPLEIAAQRRPGAPILADGKRELDKVGLGRMMFVPELRKPYDY